MKKLLFITSVLLLTLGFLPLTSNLEVKASGLCNFLPCENAGFCANGSCSDALSNTSTYVRAGFTLLFIGIIVFGIVVIVRAAIKIIQSEGDEKKIQEGSENIRGVLFGLIIIFIGVIGVVIIAALFDATGIFNQNPSDTQVPLVNVPLLTE